MEGIMDMTDDSSLSSAAFTWELNA